MAERVDHAFSNSLTGALRRARVSIAAVASAYLLSLLVGIALAQTGNSFAITTRDTLVANAQSSPSLLALKRGDRLQAAVFDFGANLLAALGDTLGGLGIALPFPIIIYRGWVGGIVSIDGSHASRLAESASAAYYVITLVMQLIPYSLAGGAGLNMGHACYWHRDCYQGKRWAGIPIEAMRDVLRIYQLVIPLMLAASLWEFMMAS